MASGGEANQGISRDNLAPPPVEEGEAEASSLKRQGSIRKVLPSLPGATDPAKLIDRPPGISGASGTRSSSQYAPYFLEYSIIPEFNLLQRYRVPGIYVIPSSKSPLVWFGVMFVRQGPYQGGVFRFNLNIPENFPDGGCPKVVFQTSVFHPLVSSSTGQLDVARAFPDWSRNLNHIWQVLEFARRVFIKIDSQAPLNPEAAQMFDSQPEQFTLAVAECVRKSQQRLYDPPPTDDPHYLSFEPYESSVHDPVRESMLSPSVAEDEAASPAGLSWVAPGSLKPFSKPLSSESMPEST